MNDLLTFFLNVSRLKTTRRTGWVWRGVKNPETIAEHSFRIAWLAWVLGAQAKLKVNRMIDTALLHDICEVYAGDLPFWHGILTNPNDPQQRQPFLKRWVRLSQQKKATLRREKFLREQKSLRRLVKPLSPETREKIISLWLEHEKGTSQEGRFVKQIDTIEALLQAIEYFGLKPDTPVAAWWEMVEEVVENPVLIRFLKTIERHLYHGEKTTLDGTLNFLIAINKLKRKPRSAWVMRRVLEPDSMANHAFLLTLMAWVFIREWRVRLRLDKVIKMALIHFLYGVTLTERGFHDTLLARANAHANDGETFSKWVRSSLKEKRTVFYAYLKRRTAAVAEVTRSLPPSLRKEIRTLWAELTRNRTPEARFVQQVAVAEFLLQALQYWAHDKKFPIAPWWEWAYEIIDNPRLLEFLDAMKKKFYTR